MKSRKEKGIIGGLSSSVDSRTDSSDSPLLFILSYILSTRIEVQPVPVLSGCVISKGVVFENMAQFWSIHDVCKGSNHSEICCRAFSTLAIFPPAKSCTLYMA